MSQRISPIIKGYIRIGEVQDLYIFKITDLYLKTSTIKTTKPKEYPHQDNFIGEISTKKLRKNSSPVLPSQKNTLFNSVL